MDMGTKKLLSEALYAGTREGDMWGLRLSCTVAPQSLCQNNLSRRMRASNIADSISKHILLIGHWQMIATDKMRINDMYRGDSLISSLALVGVLRS